MTADEMTPAPNPTPDSVPDQAATVQAPPQQPAPPEKPPRFVLDRPTWTIFRVVLGGVGIFSALAGTGVLIADQHAAYWDANPFSAKAQIIHEYLQFWFGVVVAIAVLIHVGTEVWEPPARKKTTSGYYIGVFFASLALSVAVSLFVIPPWAKMWARSSWYEKAVKSQAAAYWHARSLVERNGGEPTDQGRPIPDSWRTTRLMTAERNISQIERLFEIESRRGSLAERIEAVSPIFSSSRPPSSE